jgi:predicted enzyme related to lactoylglutathione lyase
MLGDAKVNSSFAVDDLHQALEFYGQTLGLRTTVIDEQQGLMILHAAGDQDVFVYVKPDFLPATYTVLNFTVDDVDAAVDGLTERGVRFERYEGMGQDEKGISRSPGPTVAWFKDPAGNILSVLKQ